MAAGLFVAQSPEEAEVQAFIDLVEDDLLLVNGSLLVLLGFVR
jgi:hypothetical protein